MNQYIEPIETFLENNTWWEEEPEFILLQYEIVDEMKSNNVGNESIQPILELMEKYPLVEFGTPGPLTHFIEGFYDEHKDLFEKLLVESITKNPTVHTIWILNMIINGNNSEKKEEYIQILKSIYNNKTLIMIFILSLKIS